MRTPGEGKTRQELGRIQTPRRGLATETMPYGLPRCVVRGLLRRRTDGLPAAACSRSGSWQSEEPLRRSI